MKRIISSKASLTPYLRPYLLLGLSFLMISGCATAPQKGTEPSVHYYPVPAKQLPTAFTYAPIVSFQSSEENYNQIGTPAFDDKNILFIDTDIPAMFIEKRTFQTNKGVYRNIYYRINLPKSPEVDFPINPNAGNNVGFYIVATLNSKSDPILWTIAHSSGHYLAFIPTSFMPQHLLPKHWASKSRMVDGYNLPAVLTYPRRKAYKYRPHFVFSSGLHKLVSVSLMNPSGMSFGARRQNYFLRSHASLNEVDVENDGTETMFLSTTPFKGVVKNNDKKWSELLYSWWLFDPIVGRDRTIGQADDNNVPFYTSVNPFTREKSDMRDFRSFLSFWGWQL